MIRISKVRYYSSDKLHNKFYVYTPSVTFLVKRPINEKPLASVDTIMNCKTEDDILKIGGAVAPKDGKITLEEYFVGMGLN
jgi:hypothetical protein